MTRIALREVAEKKGLTQTKIQRVTGIDTGVVRRYWRNKSASVELRYITLLCRALACTPGELLVNSDDQEKA